MYTQPDYYFESTPTAEYNYVVPPSITTRLLGNGGTALKLSQRYCEGTLYNRVHITRLQHGNHVKWTTKVLLSVVLRSYLHGTPVVGDIPWEPHHE